MHLVGILFPHSEINVKGIGCEERICPNTVGVVTCYVAVLLVEILLPDAGCCFL